MKIKTAKQILKENHYIVESNGVREITDKIIDACDEGILDWEDVAQAALQYMSEDDVADMNRMYEWIPDEDDDEDTLEDED